MCLCLLFKVPFLRFVYFLQIHGQSRGGIHNMFGVRVSAAHMSGFLAQNSLNKSHFSAYFPQTWVGLAEK